MFRFIFLGVLFLMSHSCSSESEEPAADFRISLESHDLARVEEALWQFGRENGLLVLENDRDQMQVLNGGQPAFSIWFSFVGNSNTAINVTNVNEGYYMRTMFFLSGFRDASQMHSVQEQFLKKFEK